MSSTYLIESNREDENKINGDMNEKGYGTFASWNEKISSSYR
jgi:hypothetical protein